MDNTLRKLQLTQLEILKEVDAFCREHDIKYSLYAGTLLGAVRHKGFIPWDDDLDICMSRENYNRFIHEWSKKGVKGYILQNKENTPSYTQSSTKIRKENTTFLQEVDLVGQYHVGIFIDIFPSDRMPLGKIARLIHQMNCIIFQLYTKGYVPKEANRIEKVLINIILKGVPKKYQGHIRRKLFKKITRYNKDKSCPVLFNETLAAINRPLPANLMDEYVSLQFEDGCFMCVKEWDLLLRRIYGDYMKLPAEEDRVGIHRARIIDFEHDYEEHMKMMKDTK